MANWIKSWSTTHFGPHYKWILTKITNNRGKITETWRRTFRINMKAMKTTKAMKAGKTKAVIWIRTWSTTHFGLLYKWSLSKLTNKCGKVTETWSGTLRSDMKPMKAMKSKK
jgi:hypothetical protein